MVFNLSLTTQVVWQIVTIGYIVDPLKCFDYRIMLHCGNEKGEIIIPFRSHNAALFDNQCILEDWQYSLWLNELKNFHKMFAISIWKTFPTAATEGILNLLGIPQCKSIFRVLEFRADDLTFKIKVSIKSQELRSCDVCSICNKGSSTFALLESKLWYHQCVISIGCCLRDDVTLV